MLPLLLALVPWLSILCGLLLAFTFFPVGLLLLVPAGLVAAIAGFIMFKRDAKAVGFSGILRSYPEVIIGIGNCIVGVPALALIYAVA